MENVSCAPRGLAKFTFVAPAGPIVALWGGALVLCLGSESSDRSSLDWFLGLVLIAVLASSSY